MLVLLEVATSNIQRAVEELHMPEGIRGGFDGNAGDFSKTSGRQPLLILGATALLGATLLLWRQQRAAAACAAGRERGGRGREARADVGHRVEALREACGGHLA